MKKVFLVTIAYLVLTACGSGGGGGAAGSDSAGKMLITFNDENVEFKGLGRSTLGNFGNAAIDFDNELSIDFASQEYSDKKRELRGQAVETVVTDGSRKPAAAFIDIKPDTNLYVDDLENAERYNSIITDTSAGEDYFELTLILENGYWIELYGGDCDADLDCRSNPNSRIQADSFSFHISEPKGKVVDWEFGTKIDAEKAGNYVELDMNVEFFDRNGEFNEVAIETSMSSDLSERLNYWLKVFDDVDPPEPEPEPEPTPGGGPNNGESGRSSPFCSSSSYASCDYQVYSQFLNADAYWMAYGNCLNSYSAAECEDTWDYHVTACEFAKDVRQDYHPGC